jgi:CDP-glycerol glycerophosphotransferase (TagB/SpsB family)
LRLAARRSGLPACIPILLGVAGHARGFPVMDRFSTFLAYGDEARELMTAFGVAPERIIVTGNPRYDSMVDHLGRRDEYRRRILGPLAPDTRIALVVTTGLMELDKLWLDDACRSVNRLGMKLLVKPHPALGFAPYAKWLSGDPLVSGWEGSLEEAVAACDVMLTDYSSTGFEAILYGRPLIVVNFSAHEFSYRWEDEGVGVRVSDPAALHEQLRSVVENRFSPEVLATQKRVVSRFNHLNDGRAGERIADLLAAARPA